MGIKKNQLAVVTSAAGTPLSLDEQVTPPGAGANKVKLYSKDVLGASEFFVQDDQGNEVQVTSGGVVNGGGGGSMPFGIPINVGGTYPVQLNTINVVTYAGVTLTLPATPAPDDRFGLVLGGVDVTLNPNGSSISNPVSFMFCSNPITFDYGSTGCYLEFQFSSTLGGVWAVLSKGYYGSVLDLLDESGSLVGPTQLLALDVTGAGASLSFCSGSRVATLNVPGGGGGGGQFPPVACTTASGTIYAAVGCSYYFTGSCGGSNNLVLPGFTPNPNPAPNDGDIIGAISRGTGGGFQVTNSCASYSVWYGTGVCASQFVTTSGVPYAWRFNAATFQWDQIQG